MRGRMESDMRFCDKIDNYKEQILAAENYIWKNPEPGYREHKTNAYLLKIFRDLGYEVTEAEGITGFFATLARDPHFLFLRSLIP